MKPLSLNPALQTALRWVWLPVLMIAALCVPQPLYILSLAVFGLPHIVWEMGFIRRRYAGRWPNWWWYAVCVILIGNASVRTAFWLGLCSADTTQAVDLLALMLLGLTVLFAPTGSGWRVRLAALVLMVLMWYLLHMGDVITPLLVLAQIHNFTPVLLAWDYSRNHGAEGDVQRRSRKASSAPAQTARTVIVLFVLPIIVACSGWQGFHAMSATASWPSMLDSQIPATWLSHDRPALWSAMVLAQCLHYVSVIHLLPRTLASSEGTSVLPRWVKLLTGMSVVLILLYYVHDIGGARKLYAVASGFHAWLEWPVILLAILSTQRYSR